MNKNEILLVGNLLTRERLNRLHHCYEMKKILENSVRTVNVFSMWFPDELSTIIYAWIYFTRRVLMTTLYGLIFNHFLHVNTICMKYYH